MVEEKTLEQEAKEFKEKKQPAAKDKAVKKPAAASGKIDSRVTYAAAALSGLLSMNRDQRDVIAESLVEEAFRYADLMQAKEKEAE